MHLAVFGANGPTGRLVTRLALAAGHRVVAVTRRPDEFPLESPDLDVAAADVTDADAVDRVLARRPEAVISTYGVPYGRRPITVYSDGITHIGRAMQAHGVRRLACVTSTTLATEAAPGDSLLWHRAVAPLLRRVVGRTLYDDMERMEAIVRAGDLDWTIVRPAGLFDAEAPSDDYRVAAARLPGHRTSRADLAEALIDEAVSPRHLLETVEVVSRHGPDRPLRTMLREVGVLRG